MTLLLLAASGAMAQTRPLRAPDVRYEPSTTIQTVAMLRLANVTKNDVVYDLGCGDGRLVIMAAKEFGARGVGVDIDPVRIRESLTNARQAGVEGRVRFRTQDLYDTDIREATVVMLYLWPDMNLKLRPKLWKDLRVGARVVSNAHGMGDWKPDKHILADGANLYLWYITAALKKATP
ncbi:MAG TPA: class I SAM-dependent methyltransferase [Bryobacteraceae bacterium]|nr:class I SAM-dependent methyltransferase [Bryobacteraceae bacterium]